MLQLSADQRRNLWSQVAELIENYMATVSSARVAPELDPATIRAALASFDFHQPVRADAAVQFVVDSLTRWQVHTPHPRYFGLFNPAPTTMGIAADTLVAAFNPQMAAWSHNPFAAEVERHLVRELGARLGYESTRCDGTFASGGMEANHTAVLCALGSRYPSYLESGVRSLPAQPVFYASAESHHSLLKAARLCGLGTSSVRLVPVDDRLRLRVDLLEQQITHDRRSDFAPFLIVATAGTTNAGAIDPLRECSAIAVRENLWLHTDAAWGGAAAIVPEMRPILDGIERSDSITFDAHKWLSVPMGAGVFLTRDTEILDRTFRVATAYMPKEAEGLDIVDPHLHSMQWSRRFTGLKVFLSLAVAGWDGYATAIRHQTQMGAFLRMRLLEEGWEILNGTPLPVVCFVDPNGGDERQKKISAAAVSSGEAWISTTHIGRRTVLRACITNYLTQPPDIEALIAMLGRVRQKIGPATA